MYCPSDKIRSGIPDVLALIDGHLFALELKRHGEKGEPIQLATLAKIRRAGGAIGVFDNFSLLKAKIELTTGCQHDNIQSKEGL